MSEPQANSDISTENPDRLRGNFMRLSMQDKVFLYINALILVLVGQLTNELGAIAYIGFVALLMRSVTYGRAYYVFGQKWSSLWIRYVRKGYLRQRKNRRGSLLFRTAPIPLAMKRVGTFALMHVLTEKLDAIPIMGEGSDITSKALGDQFDSLKRMGDLTKRLASFMRDYGIGVSYVYRCRPINLHALERHYEDNLHPDVIIPPAQAEEKPLDGYSNYDWRAQNLHDNAIDLLALMENIGGAPDMGMVLTVRREGKLSSGRSGSKSLAEKEVDRLSITRIAAEAVAGLERIGVTSPSTLSPDQLVDYLRGSWDIDTIQDYYAGERVASDSNWPIQWPQISVRAMHDHCILDGTYCGTVMFQAGPAWADPWYYRDLYAADVTNPSISLVGEAVHNTSDLWALTTFINIAAKVSSFAGVDRPSAAARQRQEEREQREELQNRTRFRETYQLFFGVAHWDKEIFEQEMENVIALGKSLLLNPLRVTGECRQVRAYMSAATGVNML